MRVFFKVNRAVFPVWVALLLLSCSGPAGDRPNVVLITLDTTRSDFLSCYGSELVQTPHIDSVAHHGVLFTRAHTTVPLTLPAHSSIMTGLYPPGHGVRNNGSYRLSDSIPSMAGVATAEGYSTCAVIGAFVLHSQFGIGNGFQIYDDNISGEGESQPGFEYLERTADVVTDAAISHVREMGSSPYLLWVHYFDPHSPYQPPEPYAGRYPTDPYGGEIAYVDACIGRLLGELNKLSGGKRSTITIIVGDHGEDLGDHGEMTHGAFLYESTTHVPFIISCPEKIPRGYRCEAPVSIVDVFPTVLDLLGIDTGKLTIQGKSLTGIIGAGKPDQRPLYLETRFPFESMGWSPLEGVMLGDWKYIRAPTEELYNVRDDPEERTNLFPGESEISGQLAAVLDSIESDLSNGAQSSRVEVDRETRDKLERLGYITADEGIVPDLKDPKEMISHEAVKGKGSYYFRRGEFERAVRAFTESLELDPTNVTLMNYRGLALYSLGKTGEAIEQWRKGAELRPGNLDIHLNLGMAYLVTGQLDSALESYEQVLEINPFYVKALIGKGKVLKLQSDSDDALSNFEKAVRIDPMSHEARYWLGITLKDRGKLDAALEELDHALSLKSGMIRARRIKAQILIELGKFGEAVAILDELTLQQPARSDLLLELGQALELDERPDESLAAYRKAAAIDSNSFMAHNNIGSLLDRLGKTAEAERELRTALELNDQFPHAYYNLGNLLLREGRKEEARRAFTKFLELWSQDDETKARVLETLESM